MRSGGSVNADRLKSFIERIEKLREEKKAIGQDERDVFGEAKGVGYDTKAMREVLKRRAMDSADRDEWDTLVDTYEHALGLRGEAAEIVSGGGTYDEAASKTGLSRATVARIIAGRKNLKNETDEPGLPPSGNRTEGVAVPSDSAPVDEKAISGEEINVKSTPACTFDMSTTPEEIDLTIPPHLDRRRQRVVA